MEEYTCNSKYFRENSISEDEWLHLAGVLAVVTADKKCSNALVAEFARSLLTQLEEVRFK